MRWLLLVMLWASAASAHEMTPTYPKLVPSFMEGVEVTQVTLFNKREDVQYYEIGVFDKEWKPVPFVSAYKVVRIEYLAKLHIDVYIAKEDAKKAVYLCSISKLRGLPRKGTLVSSKICSKIVK